MEQDVCILVVEDEVKVADLIKRGLEAQGFKVEIAYDGMMGRRLGVQKKYDLIILDVNLPHENGYEVCRSIRERNAKVPILFLTALDTLDDKLIGFDAGADDYIPKPFEMKELLARVRVFLKRSGSYNADPAGSRMLQVADLILDIDSKTVVRAGRKVELTAKEFHLLQYFLENKNRVVSKVDIAEKIWNITFDTGTNVIEVYVNYLRNKVDKGFDRKLIHTIIGMGYVLKEE
ncbi:response regulator transcription factor [Alistipes sp. ZOR0009]|jgi:DNA-binding response OmpR family regulator|uniref:response regulator transcription factor n=1 Tax=Alistipes sp. ZOR0009 TaxID=1339253 RepID=UPI0006467F61|nr:response regulator transcription factor [Alistipes sp. ZOR0009]